MRNLSPFWKRIVGVLAFFWTIFLIYTSLTLPLMPLFQGPICLCFALAITFLLYPANKDRVAPDMSTWSARFIFGTKNNPSILDIVVIILSIIPVFFIMIQWRGIAYNEFSSGSISTFNLFLGSTLVILLIEISRRTVGWVITTVVILFITYAFFGKYIPGHLGHKGFSVQEVIYQIYLMKEGVTGMLLDVGSRILPLYIIFGSVLFTTGAGETFMKMAQIACGRIRGGAGQVAMASSAMFGTVSGSSVANVTATGVVTIPTMKKMGFSSELAGGVEATASTGGQIMPPLMGAGAFLMAEFLGIPYTTIMAAALIPAILYFTGVAAGVYAETGRQGLGKLSLELIPKLKEVFRLRESVCLFIPLGILTYLLVRFAPAQVAAGWALVSVTLLYTFVGGNLNWASIKDRVSRLAGGYSVGLGSLAMLIAMVTCIQVAIVCISLTGIAVKISNLIIDMGGNVPFLALLLAAVVSIILGMGMPTTAAYVIAVAVAAPPLIGLGFDPLATHLFVYYFAILSGLTPPVCVTVITASTISGGNWMKMAWISMRLAVAGFVLPFFFIYDQTLLFDGPLWNIIMAGITGFIGIFFLEAGLMGMLLKPNTIIERLLLILGGFLLLSVWSYGDLIGIALIVLALLFQRFAPSVPFIGKRPAISSISSLNGDANTDVELSAS